MIDPSVLASCDVETRDLRDIARAMPVAGEACSKTHQALAPLKEVT